VQAANAAIGETATRFVGRNFNPDWNDNSICGKSYYLHLLSHTAGSTSTFSEIEDGAYFDRHPSNHGKRFYPKKNRPNDRVGCRSIKQPGAGTIIMKSYDNLYEKLCSYDNLLLAYRKAKRGKGRKWYVKEFEANLEKNLLKLEYELRSTTYTPSPMKRFVIDEPRTRIISASHFRDRIVHHAICNILEPIFEKVFICDSYASRKNKGTHAALECFDYFKRKVSGNGKMLPNAKNRNQIYGYVLKADIKHYFDSVDHETLLRIIKKKIADERVLSLIKKIIDNHECKVPGKGMPIGNLTSQFFANVYLNELDYFVKHNLKAKYYIRYLDDFVVLNSSKERLEFCKVQINDFLKTIGLQLHSDKSKVIPLHKGIRFLGFRIFYHFKMPKKGNLRKIRHRIDYFTDLYKDGIMRRHEVFEHVEGWNAYAMHANTYKMRRRMMKNLKKSIRRADKTHSS
jgi:retron-type reverse transcriptase